MHIHTYISTMFDRFDNLFAIHTYCFLCQSASKSVRLERWIVEAVVGAALKKIIVISGAIFNRGAAVDKVGWLVHVDPESVPGQECLELRNPCLPPLLGHWVCVVREETIVGWPDLSVEKWRISPKSLIQPLTFATSGSPFESITQIFNSSP